MAYTASFENYGTHDESEYPHLWNGRVLSLCPSVNPAGGTRLFDHSHYRNWGTLTNGPTWQTGNGRNVLSLDGTDDFVTCGTGLSGFFTANFSVSFWINKRATTSAFSNLWGVGQWNSGGSAGTNNWLVAIGDARAGFGNGDNLNGYIEIGSTSYNVLSSNTLTLNSWSHASFVRSGSVLSVYVNGVRTDSTGNPTSAVNSNTRSVLIGAAEGTTLFRPNAQFDDIAAYTRALGSEEIRELYMLGPGGAYTPRSRMFYPLPPQQTFLAAWARRSSQLIGGGLI